MGWIETINRFIIYGNGNNVFVFISFALARPFSLVPFALRLNQFGNISSGIKIGFVCFADGLLTIFTNLFLDSRDLFRWGF